MNAKGQYREGRRSQIDRPEYQALRKALGDALAESRIGQRELSRKLGKPEVYINRILQGRRTVEFAELLEICEGIGANPIEIFTHAIEGASKFD